MGHREEFEEGLQASSLSITPSSYYTIDVGDDNSLPGEGLCVYFLGR